MAFPHQDAEFGDLVRIVAKKRRLSPGLVEKDYWVTHTLWALHDSGLEVWFKGGTSLSKGFDLIRRFSEDLDLKIEFSGGLPRVASWTSRNSRRIDERREFFEALTRGLAVPDAAVERDGEASDRYERSAVYRVLYPGRFLDEVADRNRPFVQLEVGNARVAPFVARPLTSFVHEELRDHPSGVTYDENYPNRVRCVHPLVTLLEKLDAIAKRFEREDDAASYVRHYEDAACIIKGMAGLPTLEGGVGELEVGELETGMLEARDIRRAYEAEDSCFTLGDDRRREELENAWRDIQHMFWGERIPLDRACELIRSFLEELASTRASR